MPPLFLLVDRPAIRFPFESLKYSGPATSTHHVVLGACEARYKVRQCPRIFQDQAPTPNAWFMAELQLRIVLTVVDLEVFPHSTLLAVLWDDRKNLPWSLYRF